MLSYLPVIGYFALAALGFGFVIFIHELGHFVFAKWAGVRVDTFSIGFGRAMLKWKRGETDYVLAWLPLGGYVKMTGQEDVPSGKEQDGADPRSYLAKSPLWKAAILLGGVLFNLLSSLAILFALVAWGMPVLKPQVGGVHELVTDHDGRAVDSPAKLLGLERGDVIVAMNGETVRSMDDIVTTTLFVGRDPLVVEIERDGRRLTLPPPGAAPVRAVYNPAMGRQTLGTDIPTSNRVFAVENAPEGGIRKGDRVLAVAGEDVAQLPGQAVADRLLAHLGTPVAVTVEREGARLELQLTYGGEDDALDTRIGVPVRVHGVADWADPSLAAVRAGDVVRAVDGVEVRGPEHFQALLRVGLDAGTPIRLALLRDGADVAVEVRGTRRFGVSRLGVEYRAAPLGILPWVPPGPLAGAGFQAGDAVVAAEPAAGGARLARVRGERVLIELGLDRAGWIAANQVARPPLWRRAVGEATPPSLAERILGRRVVARTPEQLTLAGADGAAAGNLDAAALGPAAAAIQAGDWISAVFPGVDGRMRLELVRGAAAEPVWATLTPPPLGTAVAFNVEERPYQTKSFADAVDLVHDAAYNMVVKSVLLFPKFFARPDQGGIDPNKSLTGPIGIFRVLKERAEFFGLASWIKMVALVGLNLFVVNLLPIPITDGGQLLILGVETAIRRPLPMWLRNALMWAGVGLVGLMFAYVCGLDLLRLFGLM